MSVGLIVERKYAQVINVMKAPMMGGDICEIGDLLSLEQWRGGRNRTAVVPLLCFVLTPSALVSCSSAATKQSTTKALAREEEDCAEEKLKLDGGKTKSLSAGKAEDNLVQSKGKKTRAELQEDES